MPPARTISKEQFLQEYMAHSNALSRILDNLNDTDDGTNYDHGVEKSRNDLVILVKNLQEKIDKLNDLRFWMDNMIFDGHSKEDNI
ncbi:hypothetical protein TRFO_20722 [Tritrichomonas foetus]|uniref:Uncharacterized protein n=1 Tax=Tritrichomonas foetus TaxID=1144522 RepID=A0A1J4KGN2_9EUKA|nr:hypothetical protein TRFO_20722 [Tritrichomonas foetus]|eukprot:OHT10096.1 hypothetical protein TRFO_20722 [Tritrichomonas foetus]